MKSTTRSGVSLAIGLYSIHLVSRRFKGCQRHLRGRRGFLFQAGSEPASPGDFVHRAGGTTTTPLVGGPHLVLP
jgi:hypothetical protein